MFIIITLLVCYKVFFYNSDDTVQYRPKKEAIKKHNIFPGKGKILTEDFILSCREAVFSKVGYSYSVVGYTPDSRISCNNKYVSFTLRKEYGSEDFFSKNLIRIIKQNGGEFNITSNETVEIKFPLRGREIMDVNVMNSTRERLTMLKKEFDNTFLNISISESKPCGPVSSDEIKYDRKFICSDFSFQFSYNPEIIIPLIGRDDNIVINNIDYDYQSSIWALSGSYYGIQ